MRGNSQVSRCQSPSMGFTLGYLGWLSILFAFVALRCVGVHAETVEKQSELGPVSAMVRPRTARLSATRSCGRFLSLKPPTKTQTSI